MSRQWRIFVVEDDNALHRHMMNVLRKDGYVVHSATNKREAVRILWAEEHDAVICDLKTSPSDDIELLQWLRAYRPNARVIFVGAPNEAARTFALESGATSYIERPLDLNRVKEELHRLLAQTGFSANLDSFDLLDVIQIVSASHKNIALLVSTGLEERGMLCFQEGNMVWAEYGMLRGEEAFFALAAHKNGTVIHQPWNQRVTPNVTLPLSRLILQAFQYRTKYAQQQVSSQHEAVHVGQTGQMGQTHPTGRATSYEEDDMPFLVALEETPYNGYSNPVVQGQQSLQRQQDQQGRMNGKVPHGVHEMTFQNSTSEPSEPEPQARKAASKEWWQQTGKMTTQQAMEQVQQQTTDTGVTGPTENISGAVLPTIPITPIFEKPFSDSSGMRRIPPGIRKTHMRGDKVGHNNQDEQQQQGVSDKLPSWLTDQSTATHVPKVSSSPSMTPVPPTPVMRSTHPLSFSDSANVPSVPVTPRITAAEWQPLVDTDEEQGELREMREQRQGAEPRGKAQRKAQTGEQPIVRGRPSPEWQGDLSQSGSLPGITASRLVNTTVATANERESARRSSGSGKQKAIKRDYNYASLVSALQTLGYSVKGFIAAAVVTLDGQPIAQVAVDDLDISGLCQNLSQTVRNMLQLLQQGDLGEFEDTVITSGDRYLILRLIRDRGEDENAPRSDEEAFQVLITTRKAVTTECIGMMANVEGAIATALHS